MKKAYLGPETHSPVQMSNKHHWFQHLHT